MMAEKEDGLLRGVPLFAGLNGSALREIRSAAQVKSYPKDTFLFYQDETVERLYVVEAGRVKLFQLSSDGQQVMMRVATEGMMIALISLVENAVYPVSAQAAEDCRLLFWSQADMLRLLDRYPRLALNGLRLLGEHLREFQDRYRELATERVERRLARTIIRLAAQTGKKTPEGVLLDLQLSRQDLAEMSGTTLFTVSRIISKWEAQGLIQAGRERIVLLFPHGLVRIADDLPGFQEKRD